MEVRCAIPTKAVRPDLDTMQIEIEHGVYPLDALDHAHGQSGPKSPAE
jgi:hypothetical protein